MFVSHQWLSNGHPDPKFEQLRVLQTAMRDLLSGAVQVSLAPADELIWGRVKCPKATDFQDLFLWYDYFCIPQSEESHGHRYAAIDSIPCPDSPFTTFFYGSGSLFCIKAWTLIIHALTRTGLASACFADKVSALFMVKRRLRYRTRIRYLKQGTRVTHRLDP